MCIYATCLHACAVTYLLQSLWEGRGPKEQGLMSLNEGGKPTQQRVLTEGVSLTPFRTRRQRGSWTREKEVGEDYVTLASSPG